MGESWSVWNAFMSEKRHEVDQKFQAYLADQAYWEKEARQWNQRCQKEIEQARAGGLGVDKKWTKTSAQEEKNKYEQDHYEKLKTLQYQYAADPDQYFFIRAFLQPMDQKEAQG